MFRLLWQLSFWLSLPFVSDCSGNVGMVTYLDPSGGLKNEKYCQVIHQYLFWSSDKLNLGCFICWTIPYLSKGSIISSWNAATIMSSFAQLIDVMVINNTNKFYQRTWCVIWNIGCLICLQCQISILWEVERLTIVCKIWKYCNNAYNAFSLASSFGRTTRTISFLTRQNTGYSYS